MLLLVTTFTWVKVEGQGLGLGVRCGSPDPAQAPLLSLFVPSFAEDAHDILTDDGCATRARL
jgi:hypothetical protein